MAVSVPIPVKKQFSALLTELDKRAKEHRKLEGYYEGHTPLPPAIVWAKVTKAYRSLMPVAEAPWGSLVVDSTQDRLEVAGIDTGDKDTDKRIWDLWQRNQMDAESKIAQNAALVDGRAFALVWPADGGRGEPEVSLDNSATMIVQYREGSRRHRVGALRRWKDDDVVHANLYRPDGIYKFRQSKEQTQGNRRIKAGGEWWEAREVDDEEWPLANPYGVVPVVEVAVNRRLKPGAFPYARGEYAHCLGLIDRINLLTFLGLVVAFWMGFPLRGVIGEKLERDDDGEPIAPFDAHASGIAQLENPNAKTFEYSQADRSNLSVFAELDHLATITKTPRHYLPMEGGMSNLSADAIRASEGALHAKVTEYKATMGEGWEEVLRLCGLMDEQRIIVPPTAELRWMDHQSRSMAERADAATKVASIGFPWQTVAERYLNFTPEEIAKVEAQQASGAFGQLLASLEEETVEEESEPAAA